MSKFLSTRVTSLLLAAMVTVALLGSIEWVAAAQVGAARLAQQHTQATSHVAITTACRIDG